MKVNGHIKWLKIPITKNGASVQGIFIGDTYENINIDLSKWKSLISESSIHDGVSTKKVTWLHCNALTLILQYYPPKNLRTQFIFSLLKRSLSFLIDPRT